MDWMPQAVRDGIIVVLIISGPLVLAAAFIGLVIGVLQAATQVQEQTIGSALKIIGVFALIIFAGFWMYQYLNQYTSRTIATAFTFVTMQTPKVVPPDAFKGKGQDESFGEKIDAIDQPLEVIKPEKLEEKLPEGGLPPGAPYLGAPEIPKPPSVSKILPPEIPKIPAQPFKPTLPLSDFQEPKAITDTEGTVNNDEANQNNTEAPGDNLEDAGIEGQKINLVPGEPVESTVENREEISIEPLKNDELVLEEKTKNSNLMQPSEENTKREVLPSWLD